MYMKYIHNYLLLFIYPFFLTNCAVKRADLRELPKHWHATPKQLEKNPKLKQSRAFAKHTSIYAIASLAVYSDDPRKVEPIPFPSVNEKWLALEKNNLCYENRFTGFAAKSWLHTDSNNRKELVVAYRGTGSIWIRDCLFGNLIPFSGMIPYNQYHEARKYALKKQSQLMKAHPKLPIVLVGHSLGGGLAEYVQRTLPNSRAITFNTSPNNGRIISSFKSDKPQIDWVRVYERGEFLSFLRRPGSPDFCPDSTPSGKGLRTAQFDSFKNWKMTPTSNPFKGHSIHDHCLALLKISATTGDPSALEVIHALEKRRPNAMLEDKNSLRDRLNIHRFKLRKKLLTDRTLGKQANPENSSGAFWRTNE